jgi:membrane-associated protease RseP (regulator of RpoE activity)
VTVHTLLNALALPALVVVHVGSTAALALLLRVRTREINLGVGPAVWAFALGEGRLAFRLLPIAGSVRFEEEEDGDDLPERPRVSPGREFSTLSRWERAALHATGVVATGFVAVALLGSEHAWRSAWSTWGQWFGGAFDPLGRGMENWLALHALLRDAPWPVCAGVLAAKTAGFNAVPMPPLSGFQFLHSLLGWPREGQGLTWLMNLSVFAYLGMILSYLVSLFLLLR